MGGRKGTVYPSPYPYPYQYQPFPVAPPQPSTPKGMSWCVRALMLHLVALVLLALAGAVAIAVLANVQPGQNPFQLLALLLPIFALMVSGYIIEIVVLIFYLIGFGYLYKGRNEFGPSHARNARLALYLLILAFVLQLAATVTGFVLSSFAFRFEPFGPQPTFTFDANMYYAAQAVGIGFGIVIAALVAAHLVLAIRVLAKPQHERLLYVAAAVGTATPGIWGALLLLVLPRYIASFADAGTGPPPIGPDIGLPILVASGLNIVTFVLFLLAFRGAETRLRSGELKLTLPPPQATSWMPAPVVPYAPYGPYAPQVPVMPTTPPQQPPPTPPGA